MGSEERDASGGVRRGSAVMYERMMDAISISVEDPTNASS